MNAKGVGNAQTLIRIARVSEHARQSADWRHVALIVVLALIGISIWYLQAPQPHPVSSAQAEIPVTQGQANSSEQQAIATTARIQAKQQQYERAKEIVAPAGFINTNNQSIAIKDIIGKRAILIDFWTYSCINCQRTTPYLTGWYEKYKDQGLEIIGVHTPEFGFEKKYENVLEATKRFGITYPVVLDNDYGTWSAYKNRYWPRKYLIDIDGFIVYDHAGEGAYDEAESKIQDLLKERMDVLGITGNVSTGIVTPIAEVPEGQSPETYFGASRNEFLANGKPGLVGIQSLTAPKAITTNKLYLVGDWNMEPEFAEHQNVGATIIFAYQAKSVYLVASADTPVQAIIMLDGQPLTGAHAGEDVKDGILTVQEARLYKIVQNSAVGEHVLEIRIQQPGLKAYTFTFG